MLGLFTSAALREYGYETVYCSGIRHHRSMFIDRFGAIPVYNGKCFLKLNDRLIVTMLYRDHP
jgi:hypothetical protein